ncbi:MAG TPA: hypothetical protein VI704_05180, partial [Bacteroidota bacterium]|nr:hypothetical protein [Bacteroidota bacterium]
SSTLSLEPTYLLPSLPLHNTYVQNMAAFTRPADSPPKADQPLAETTLAPFHVDVMQWKIS